MHWSGFFESYFVFRMMESEIFFDHIAAVLFWFTLCSKLFVAQMLAANKTTLEQGWA